MNSKTFVVLALFTVTIAVGIGNTNLFVTNSFATEAKSFHGGFTNSFSQSCDAFKCVTKEVHGKPGSSTDASIACFDLLGINLCDNTPSSKNN
jgi:hypothetical protein